LVIRTKHVSKISVNYFYNSTLLALFLCSILIHILGAEPYAIFEGYNGMVSGGSHIRRLQWDDVSGFLEKVSLNRQRRLPSLEHGLKLYFFSKGRHDDWHVPLP